MLKATFDVEVLVVFVIGNDSMILAMVLKVVIEHCLNEETIMDVVHHWLFITDSPFLEKDVGEDPQRLRQIKDYALVLHHFGY